MLYTNCEKERIFQPLRHSQWSEKGATTEQHAKGQVNIREGTISFPGNQGEAMPRWYTGWAFRGVNGWKRKKDVPDKDIDLGKFSSVGAQVYGLSRGIAWK